VLVRRGPTILTGFKFGDFKVRVPSDGAASMAVKGLRIFRSEVPSDHEIKSKTGHSVLTWRDSL